MHGWKKCPFCGGEVVVDDRKSFQSLLRQYGSACLQAKCANRDCGCTLFVYSMDSEKRENMPICLSNSVPSGTGGLRDIVSTMDTGRG